MNGHYPPDEDQRTLTQAGDSVDELLVRAIADRYPDARFSEHMARGWKEEFGFVGEAAEPVEVKAPVDGKPTQLAITEELREACDSLLPCWQTTQAHGFKPVMPSRVHRSPSTNRRFQ